MREYRNDLSFPLVARSVPSFLSLRGARKASFHRHCEECHRHDEAISLRGFPTLNCSPCSSLRGRTEVLTKQSLFSRTFGIPAQLQPRTQRLPRATCVALAVTDWGPEIASGTCSPAITDRKRSIVTLFLLAMAMIDKEELNPFSF